MPTVATFYQLQDGEIELGNPDIDRTFTQSVGVAPASGEGALVTWMARRKGTGSSVTYTVTLNGNLLNTYTLTSADRFAVHETTDTTEVIQGNNEIVFRITSGTGFLKISDLMLWHRVNV